MVVGSSKVSCVESGQPGTSTKDYDDDDDDDDLPRLAHSIMQHAPSIHPSCWDTSQPGFTLSGLGCGGGLIKAHE